jgi:CubicO group peptidase (beta-lactamase class C family)
MRSFFVFFGLLAATALLFSSCDKDDDNEVSTKITTTAELTTALQDIYNQSDAPGFAISVIEHDNIIYQQAFGHADIAAERLYTNTTVQPIGSISKTFIGAAIVKAIEQGHFTLETDINDILPVRIENPLQPDEVIRIKHLVTHTSSLIDEEEAYLKAYHILPGESLEGEGAMVMQTLGGIEQRSTQSLANYLNSYYLSDGSLYSNENFLPVKPGNVWAYSNIASGLAAYVLEVATGRDFASYVAEEIWAPLGMNHTTYDPMAFSAEEQAQLYWEMDAPLPVYHNDCYPDGSVRTSNEDLAKYMQDMMRGASGQGGALFSPAAYEQLFSNQLSEGIVPAELEGEQAVFWFLKDGNIEHSGSDPGLNTNMIFNANGQAGFLLLSNMDASVDEHDEAAIEFQTKVVLAIESFLANN